MEIEYIFIQKEETPIEEGEVKYGLFPKFFLFLEKDFINLTKNSFDFEYKKRIYTIYFNCVNCRSGENGEYPMSYFTISINLKVKQRGAEVLDFVNQTILKHEDKSEYTVINSYDGVSKYYCDRAYPKFNEFERKIRSLIFRLLTKDFGEQWLNETTTVEQRNEYKEKLRCKQKSLKEQKLIEEALYAMDISQLELFLFAPTRHMPIGKLLDEEFSEEKLKKLTNKELLLILDNLKPRSVWEKCFKEQVSIENLQQKLKDLRLFRNMVAHSKFFYRTDFDQAVVKLIDDLLQQIEVAIYDVSINKYEPLTLQDKVFGLASTFKEFALNDVSFGLTPDWLADYVTKISKMQNMMAGVMPVPFSSFGSDLPALGVGVLPPELLSHDSLNRLNQKQESLIAESNIERLGLNRNPIYDSIGMEVTGRLNRNTLLVSQIEKFNNLVKPPAIEILKNRVVDQLMRKSLSAACDPLANMAYQNVIDDEKENNEDVEDS